MKLGILKVNYMKKTKLAILIGLSVLAFNSFANENMSAPVEKSITTEDLSQIRMKIQQEKLQQQLEQERLNKLRSKAEQAKIQDQMDGTNSTIRMGNSNLPQDMRASEEDRLARDQGLKQNVGFVYQSDLQNVSSEQNNNRSNSIIDALTGNPNDPSSNPDELSKVLQKFDDLKKEADINSKSVNEYVVTKTFLGADITMLSIFDTERSAKLKFTYMHDDGIQKKKISSIITAYEGKTFGIEDDQYKVDTIDKDGVVIINTNTNEKMILTRSR